MSSVTCPSCGSPVAAGDRFCSECGHELGPPAPVNALPAVPGPPAVPPQPLPAPPTPALGSLPQPLEQPWLVSAPSRALFNASNDAPRGVQPLLAYEVAYPARLSRLRIFVKWLLVIPHLFALWALGLVLMLTTVFAWFAILVTGRYPRPLWDFAVNTLRWGANVGAYMNLQRDEYPPFSGTALYPVRFQLDYPARLSRLLIFLKGILLIPHFIVYYLVNLLLAVVLVIAWFAILITGRFPRGLFDFVSGASRWSSGGG
jgi:hypothetical protein